MGWGYVDTKLHMVLAHSPKVYNGLQSSFVSLAWPWSGRSLPKGNQWECWDPGLGPNVVRLPALLPPNIWPTQSLTGWHFVRWLVGWPIAAGKMAGCWLPIKQNANMTLPQTETFCGQVCDSFDHKDLWSYVLLIATFHGQVLYYFGWADLW